MAANARPNLVVLVSFFFFYFKMFLFGFEMLDVLLIRFAFSLWYNN